jgi:hypothetical protein
MIPKPKRKETPNFVRVGSVRFHTTYAGIISIPKSLATKIEFVIVVISCKLTHLAPFIVSLRFHWAASGLQGNMFTKVQITVQKAWNIMKAYMIWRVHIMELGVIRLMNKRLDILMKNMA